MRIDLGRLSASYETLHVKRASDASAAHRVRPRLSHYDYLALSTLREDVARLVAHTCGPGLALDLGCGESPYRDIVERAGFDLRTLDVTDETHPDYVGTAEQTGLDAESFDLVLCTQVIEHVDDPWAACREMARILRPSGHVILTAPHVWFFHPHPHDHWRFTQEGIIRLLGSCGLMPKELLSQGGSLLALCQIVNFLAYGVVGKIGAPLYATMNVAARLDQLVDNDLFCLNFACLAERAPHSAASSSGRV